VTALERDFQIARSGQADSIQDIRRRLKREGGVSGRIRRGSSVRRQFVRLTKEAKTHPSVLRDTPPTEARGSPRAGAVPFPRPSNREPGEPRRRPVGKPLQRRIVQAVRQWPGDTCQPRALKITVHSSSAQRQGSRVGCAMKAPPARSRTRFSLIGVSANAKSSTYGSRILARGGRYREGDGQSHRGRSRLAHVDGERYSDRFGGGEIKFVERDCVEVMMKKGEATRGVMTQPSSPFLQRKRSAL
jgi:hypothetical protein